MGLYNKLRNESGKGSRRSAIRMFFFSCFCFFFGSQVSLAKNQSKTKVPDEKQEEDLSGVIYAEKHGVVNSSSVDSSKIITSLIEKNLGKTIVLPPNFSVSQSIKYPGTCHIKGADGTGSICWILPNFSGLSVFEPIKKSKLSSLSVSFTNITFSDLSAKNDGKGTTSTVNCIDITGTFAARVKKLKGVRVNCVLYCEPGIEVQQTSRTLIDDIDGSNVNYLIHFLPCNDDRLAYGDLYLTNIKTTGSIANGVSIEDVDGITWLGLVLFPNASVRISGHYLNLTVCHPFEPKARLGQDMVSAEALYIPKRLGGGRSHYVTISNYVSAFAGRLADTTIGSPQHTNLGAFGIKVVNVTNFTLNAIVNDPSMGALHLVNCENGVFTLASTNTNTQKLGSGALAPGLYDVVLMQSCKQIIGTVTDSSPDKRFVINMDDFCQGCCIDAVSSIGYADSIPYRLPDNSNNIVRVLHSSSNGYIYYDSVNDKPTVIKAALNSPLPGNKVHKKGCYLVFDNTQETLVSDLPGIDQYQDVYVNIQEDYTALLDISRGGMFRLGGDNFKGKGKVLHLVRESSTGELIKL